MLVQSEGGWEIEGQKKSWVVAGIRPVIAKSTVSKMNREQEEEEKESTTPTTREARIPERLPCPPAPRKRRPLPSRCQRNDVEFFVPPELETVFINRSRPWSRPDSA